MAKRPKKRRVTGGVDTHKDTHHAAVVLMNGRRLADAQFPATTAGYRALVAWIRGFGRVHAVGVEGTGSYGAALAGHLIGEGVKVIEVNRPDRRQRRARDRSDPLDAYAAADAVLADRANAVPKAGDGITESIRALHIIALGCGQIAHRLHERIAPAADHRCRPGGDRPTAVHLRRQTRPAGFRGCVRVLVRCVLGAASSGKTTRHRLNRGGDRQANRALYLIAVSRMAHDARTRAYVARRTADGLSKKEIIRCLKRYIARELYKILTHPKPGRHRQKILKKPLDDYRRIAQALARQAGRYSGSGSAG
jgi:hypothetical protein